MMSTSWGRCQEFIQCYRRRANMWVRWCGWVDGRLQFCYCAAVYLSQENKMCALVAVLWHDLRNTGNVIHIRKSHSCTACHPTRTMYSALIQGITCWYEVLRVRDTQVHACYFSCTEFSGGTTGLPCLEYKHYTVRRIACVADSISASAVQSVQITVLFHYYIL